MEDSYNMRKCSKCNIEKEDNMFSTYFHSTQNKHRTRNVCKPCFNEQKKDYRESIKNKKIIQPVVTELQPEPIIVINPIELRECKTCLEKKPRTEYYVKGTIRGVCKECEKNRAKQNLLEKRIEQGGSLKVRVFPNNYSDEYQKDMVFSFMERLGWVFNEENGTWWKDGIKNKDGIFNNVRDFKKRTVTSTYPIENIQKLKDMRDSGLTYTQISIKTGISGPSIRVLLKRLEDEKE